ncbi:unnamed protein product, partial [Ixodes hexagonus]
MVNVAMATRGQSKNSRQVSSHYRWHEERKFRVTSSSAHSIRVRQKPFMDLARQMVNKKPFSTAATRYGLQNEGRARKALENELKAPILETGLLVLPEQPWLACSPDGLVKYQGHTVVVEIKC